MTGNNFVYQYDTSPKVFWKIFQMIWEFPDGSPLLSFWSQNLKWNLVSLKTCSNMPINQWQVILSE